MCIETRRAEVEHRSNSDGLMNQVLKIEVANFMRELVFKSHEQTVESDEKESLLFLVSVPSEGEVG